MIPVNAPLLRPRDADALRAEIRALADRTGVPMVFGGEVHEDVLVLTEFVGAVTNGLRGLPVRRASGLGGRVVDMRRQITVTDYYSSDHITHHYDRPVAGEGIRSVIAVPVVVGDRSRAVLYAATRGDAPLGDRTAELMVRSSGRLAHEIAVRDEVDRRLRLLEFAAPTAATAPAATEELRTLYAELSDLSHDVGDDGLRARLYSVCERMARALHEEPAPQAPRLSRRELDVLGQISLGCTNQEAAQRLSLGPETVKSYLRNAMVKLDARTRYEAVVVARRFGLLP